MRKFWIALLIAAVVAVAGVQIYKVYIFFLGSKGTDEVAIAKDDAESLDVDIDFGTGTLLVEGGADGWVDGTIDTNVKKWKPVVGYKQKRGTGYVTVHQQSSIFKITGRNRNDWKLQLTKEVPIDLSVDMGVSDSQLNLSGIRLSKLSIDAGVGDTTVDLSGDWQDGFTANFDMGVGDMEVILPKHTGVKLKVSKGIGSVGTKQLIAKGNDVYVNEAYGQSDVVIEIKADIGVGDVNFIFAD
ncbi:hypothetical protein DV702_08690 [Sporosarcina sp. PTS2304]|uniref:toast rack family protein n=1 Tax=Sporosarcina sp. PTS2304 TaxID=2283194 RepID=UPI000E0D494B|nr:toast rack family protein [Sporosarcina sp. PTS2304]AXH99803.1 hypothetical protein DV702_08690 [Sporosarcina sp. PTS2304]